MYKRSLLAYEGSAEGRTALREGALLARQCGAKVFLLSVLADYDTLLSTEADLAGTSVPGYGIVGCVDHVVGPEALDITDDRNGSFLDPAGQLFPHPRFCLALTYRCRTQKPPARVATCAAQADRNNSKCRGIGEMRSRIKGKADAAKENQ